MLNFRKMKLRSYLLSIFVILIILAGIIATVGLLGLRTAQRNTDILTKQIMAEDDAVMICRIQANVAARDLREMVLTGDVRQISNIEENINNSMQ